MKRILPITGLLMAVVFLSTFASSALASSSFNSAGLKSGVSPLLAGARYATEVDYVGVGMQWKGAYAVMMPQTTHFDTDWFSYTEEYWMSLTVRKANYYYAEIGLDIGYNRLTGQWHTYAYAVYSHDSYYGYLIGTFDLGYSSSAPAVGNVEVTQSSGNTWIWRVGGTQFASHTYPENWYGEYIASQTEAYNQPQPGTANQLISSVNSIVGRKSDGTYVVAPYLPPSYVYNGWMVRVSRATTGIHQDSSTRT